MNENYQKLEGEVIDPWSANCCSRNALDEMAENVNNSRMTDKIRAKSEASKR